MEKTLVKTALYTFIAAFALLTTSLDRTKTIKLSNGMYTGKTLSYPDFFFEVLQYSIKISLLFTVIVGILFAVKKFSKR